MILLIDNYDSFTWNLVHRLGELDPSLDPDRDLAVARNDKITPEEADSLDQGRGPSHVIISPGPCTPAEAGVSSAIIRHFAGRVPVLGVCLGHQCIGDIHGMTVARHTHPVHGKTSPVHHDGRGLFSGLPNPFTAARYHSLVVLADWLDAPMEPRTSVSGSPAPDASPNLPPSPTPPLNSPDWQISAWTDEPLDDGRTHRVIMGLRRVWPDSSHAPLDGVQFHPESFMTPDGYTLLANFLRSGARPRNVTRAIETH